MTQIKFILLSNFGFAITRTRIIGNFMHVYEPETAARLC
jgi:hypothetical protein